MQILFVIVCVVAVAVFLHVKLQRALDELISGIIILIYFFLQIMFFLSIVL